MTRLSEMVAKAAATFNALSPVEQAARRQAQRESWVRSMTLIDEASDEAKTRQAAYRKRHDPADPFRWAGDGEPPRRWFVGNTMVYRSQEDAFDD